jgi:8-oxo-dGTP pyrophosphatase MutT (NUDIX family)
MHGYFNKDIAKATPSVILISPKNEILLLHRVKTSTSFASAHVFPGGNLSSQDGSCPPPEDHARHEDSPSYRRAAIRELFEESGILLAKEGASKKMLVVDEETRENGRRLIHQNKVTFAEWLRQQNATAEPDIGEFFVPEGSSKS